MWLARFLFNDERAAGYYHLFLAAAYIATIAYHLYGAKRHFEDYHKYQKPGHISQVGR